MQISLRPYVTSGLAIAGASIIAIAPIQPTPPDIHIANPVAEVSRNVQLTARELETAINDVLFNLTDLELQVATIPAPLVGALLNIR